MIVGHIFSISYFLQKSEVKSRGFINVIDSVASISSLVIEKEQFEPFNGDNESIHFTITIDLISQVTSKLLATINKLFSASEKDTFETIDILEKVDEWSCKIDFNSRFPPCNQTLLMKAVQFDDFLTKVLLSRAKRYKIDMNAKDTFG